MRLVQQFILLTSEQDTGSFQIDPFSLGLGDETIAELSPEKQRVVREVLYDLSGIVDSEFQAFDIYRAGEKGDMLVRILEGVDFNEEGEVKPFYIHELQHPNGELDWQISASMNRINFT